MATVYITQDESFIGKRDERLQIRAEKKTILDVPLIKVDGVVILGRATISPAALIELLERGIPLSFLTGSGRYLGQLQPELTKNLFVRVAQWEARGSEQEIHVVQAFIRGKLKNYRQMLLRASREEPELTLAEPIEQLKQTLAQIPEVSCIESLRGLEGSGSAIYFSVFDHLIRKPDFSFKSRKRRPPTDPVNALLSLGYALLRHDLQSAINIVGFDPYLGYLHRDRYGRPSLALDLMEEFRPLVVDAVVLSAINRCSLTPEEFTTEPLSGAVSLSQDGLRTFLRLYETKVGSTFKHPVLQRKCTYREAYEIQARLLAKYLMGQTEHYPSLILR